VIGWMKSSEAGTEILAGFKRYKRTKNKPEF
jgi:hypothetical protein